MPLYLVVYCFHIRASIVAIITQRETVELAGLASFQCIRCSAQGEESGVAILPTEPALIVIKSAPVLQNTSVKIHPPAAPPLAGRFSQSLRASAKAGDYIPA